MHPARRGSLALVSLLALGSACIEVSEDLVLEADGSGTLSLTLDMDAMLATGGGSTEGPGCEDLIEEREGLRVIAREGGASDGRYLCRETIAFDALELLNDPADPSNRFEWRVERHLFRDVHHFRQEIAADPEGIAVPFAADMRWRFHVRMPGTIVDGNADHTAGADANWSRPILDVASRGLTLTATSSRTSGTRVALAVAGAGTLTLALLLWGARGARPGDTAASTPSKESTA